MKFALHWKFDKHTKTTSPVMCDKSNTDMKSYGWAFDRIIDLEPSEHVDNFAVISAAVEEMRREQASHQNAITQLERNIQELMCIEHKESEQ